MKQFQFSYKNKADLQRELRKIKQWSRARMTSAVTFQIFTELIDHNVINSVCRLISDELPEAQYMGCSSNGNIMDGTLSETAMIICCNVFEYPSTKVQILQFPLSDEVVGETMAKLHEYLAENTWVKAIELLVTIRGMSMTAFCEALQKERTDIKVFGGGAFSADIDNNAACVFSSDGECSDNSVVFQLMGGEDLHFTTTHITGWKPLGKIFRVTRAKGSILYELDGRAAYEAYYKYLNIKNNEHFFFNSLEFPFFYEHNGLNILRAPVSSNPDGSLTMTADIEENVRAHLAYGDPWTILDSIRTDGQVIRDFMPDAVKIYSCAARRTFWGDNDIGKESLPFQSIAPTSGFYTSGEFLRTDGKMNQHNVTMVVAAVREGDPVGEKSSTFDVDTGDFSGKVSLITRLAKFIDAATEELEEANHKLALAAVSDGLTGLFNRKEIQRIITERLESGKPLSLIMMDIDNFKHVNDTYGHNEGDNVIIGLSDMLRSGIAANNENASAGRWGGEEFMLMLPYEPDYAIKAAEAIRNDFADIEFPAAGHQTLSLGVTAAIPGESADALLVRVDKALYEAKKTGKNKYVVY